MKKFNLFNQLAKFRHTHFMESIPLHFGRNCLSRQSWIINPMCLLSIGTSIDTLLIERLDRQGLNLFQQWTPLNMPFEILLKHRATKCWNSKNQKKKSSKIRSVNISWYTQESIKEREWERATTGMDLWGMGSTGLPTLSCDFHRIWAHRIKGWVSEWNESNSIETEIDAYKEPSRGQFAQNLFLLGSQKLQRLVLIVPPFTLLIHSKP